MGWGCGWFERLGPVGHGGGLEEFHDVAGGVLQQDLLAAGAFQDGVAEGHAGGAEAGGLGFNVRHDEVDAVPAAGAGLGAIRHGLGGGTGGAVEGQAEVAARHLREGSSGPWGLHIT